MGWDGLGTSRGFDLWLGLDRFVSTFFFWGEDFGKGRESLQSFCMVGLREGRVRGLGNGYDDDDRDHLGFGVEEGG